MKSKFFNLISSCKPFALLVCAFGASANEEAVIKAEGLDLRVACFATFLPADPQPHNVVFPIAHFGMQVDLESKIAALVPQMRSQPTIVLETAPPTNPLTAACMQTPRQDFNEQRRRVAALVANAPGVQKKGLHPALVEALPPTALYFLAAADCTGQFDSAPPLTTEKRIMTVATKFRLQVNYLEDADAFLCPMMTASEQDLLDGAVSYIEACHEHDAATQSLFDAIYSGEDLAQTRENYDRLLRQLGHRILSSASFRRRDVDLRQRVETMATLALGSRVVFVGAHHLPSWMKDRGRSPAGWEVRDLCR